ncbi:MAG: chitobiase/beta-hexosaminidase C-terminal domain-containing protein [Acidiferrobacterales bacterium]|nr:chitobiase/beta-hexosaminidase C-terminal domain-containing protein [Acidiferrobacterales bacterium]
MSINFICRRFRREQLPLPLILCTFSLSAHAEWFFRGTPNGWQTTSMESLANNQFETCQNFQVGNNPRFKIDRFGNWNESYPPNDYGVDGGNSYRIQFDANSKSISVTQVTNCSGVVVEDQWYFRGTPNQWATTLMEQEAPNKFCTEQSFGDQNPRFKIDHFADWSEAYPSSDYLVTANRSYKICIDSLSKSISVDVINGEPDLEAPVVSASPTAGTYNTDQSIRLMVNDNIDTNPIIYFTLDGSEPTGNSQSYTSDTLIDARNTVSDGTDLVIRTLAIDASGNQQLERFEYLIDINEGPSGMADFREETIYFLLTARFYDGDASNNYYNRDRIEPGDPHWRGDFKGLIQQLDYIQDLGFTAIWVTPPVENRSGLDYHGYHAYDFYKVDPRLESEGASYQDFIDAAHAKGLKVIQDVVINHSSQYGLRDQVWIDHLPIKYYVPQGGEQGEVINGPYLGNLGDYQSSNRDDNDNSVAPQWFKDRHNSDPEGVVPLVDPLTGETVPKAGYNPNRFFGIDAQTLDPNWYHLDGFMAGGDWENPQALFNKHLAGDTIDLATERQNVKDYLNGAIKQYLDMGVDAIRLDTVKHIERDELLGYVNTWKSHKPNLFVFGENLVKGTGLGSELSNDNASAVIRPWWYTRTTPDPSNPNAGGDSGFSVLDFSVFSTFRDNVTRGDFNGLGGILSWDWIYGDATQLVTFFQNHDVGPDNDFKYRYGGSEANAAMAYNLLWTNRGIPTLYYGEEVMFQAGLPQDIAGNNDTVAETGRAYYGNVIDSGDAQNHNLYRHIKRLNQIRKAVPALQKAPTTRVNEWGAGLSFVRDYNDGESVAIVGLAAGTSQNISVNGIRNGRYVDAVTGNVINVSNGTLSFTVNNYSAGIYVLNGPGKIGQDGTYLR